jgi:hypothetical protein
VRGGAAPIALGLFATLWAGVALARDAPACRSDPGPDKVAVMRVTGAGPAHFFEAWGGGCPEAGERCRKRGYVLPGEEVLAEDAGGGFVCAWYIDGKRRLSSGALPAARLAPTKAEAPAPGSLAGWAGAWRMAGVGRADDLTEVEIAIVVDQARLKALGEGQFPYTNGRGELTASEGWFGGDNSGDAGQTAAMVAQHGAAAVPKDGLATFTDDDGCRVEARRVGALLVVEDNGYCGGIHASFSGIYWRDGPVPTKTGK